MNKEHLEYFMSYKYYNYTFVILLLYSIVLLPCNSYANAGVPMIFVTLPSMGIALIPIILIEAFVFTKYIKVRFSKSLLSNSISNIVSTILGIPLAWYFLHWVHNQISETSCGPGMQNLKNIIITIFIEANTVCPWTKNISYIVYGAFIINLIIAFILSLLVEYIISYLFFKSSSKILLLKTVIVANILSYAIVIISFTIYIVISEYYFLN